MGYDHNKEKIFSYKSSIPQKDDVQLRDVKLQFDGVSSKDYLILGITQFS